VCVNSKTYACTVAPKRAHNYFNAHPCPALGVSVCVVYVCVCVCVCLGVSLLAVFIIIFLLFYFVEFFNPSGFFLLFSLVRCCCFCFSSTLWAVARYWQFSHSKPIRKRPVKCHCVLLLLLLFCFFTFVCRRSNKCGDCLVRVAN